MKRMEERESHLPRGYEVVTVTGVFRACTSVWHGNKPRLGHRTCWVRDADKQHDEVEEIVRQLLEEDDG